MKEAQDKNRLQHAKEKIGIMNREASKLGEGRSLISNATAVVIDSSDDG